MNLAQDAVVVGRPGGHDSTRRARRDRHHLRQVFFYRCQNFDAIGGDSI